MSVFAGRPIEIETVMFREPVISISFMEKRKQTDSVAITETIHINWKEDSRVESIMVILEELYDLIDEGQLEVRNPPRKLSAVERVARGVVEDDYEEDYEDEVADED